MDANEQTINAFSTRVRQMLMHYTEMKRQNADLQAAVSDREAQIGRLERELSRMRGEYDLLKTAKMLEVTDGDIEGAKKRVAKLVRDVNKCITLLSEK